MTLSLTIEQRALTATLKRLAAIVETRNTIPILSNVAIRATDSHVTLTVTDLDIEATATIPATVMKPGETTIPAKMFADIVGKLPAGSLVSITLDNGIATVAAGRSRFTLSTLPIEDFPALATGDFAATFTLPSQDLTRLFSTIFAASTDETRYYLQGVYLHQRDGQTVAVTTNGHQLAKIALDAPHAFPGVIVPRKTVLEAARAFADGDVEVSVSETKMRLASPGFTILSKVIDGTFPDYTRVIPSDHPASVSFNSDELRLIVDRVLTVSGDKIRSVKVTVEDGSIIVENRNPQNMATDSMTADTSGAGIAIGFNGAYLLDIMKQCGGQVTMEYNGPSDPALFRSNGAVYILMPYRIQ